MTLTERRKNRQKLYRLIAMMHAGPLGFELVTQVRQLATTLLGDLDLPQIGPPPAAALYTWNYSYCSGNPIIGCHASSPKDCLVAKFLTLAQSAAKGAKQRRLSEASLIQDDLIPCMLEATRHMTDSSYKSLLDMTHHIVAQDAVYITRHPGSC